jgi:two-component system, OmpR family, KDP operon response regulator KdpE
MSNMERGTNWRIAIVEDDAGVRDFLRMAVEQEGWIAECAGSANGALALVERNPPDLVVLDLGLPDMDGTTLIRKIRQSLSIPIVVLSARTQESEKIHALDSGADDYLTKPIGNMELKARLRAHLRRKWSPAARIQLGSVEIDLEARKVFKDGCPVHLTPIEFKILGVLCGKFGRVVSQRELLNEVWGGDCIENATYLRIHVGHLRAKLEDKAALPRHILTELGIGYRLVE